MINSITIQNFFSFGESQVIELNNESNILLGINGSGKSNFIKAIKLLYDGIVGEGFEKIFSQKWGGISNCINFSNSDYREIIIKYEFDKDVLKNILNQTGYHFKTNPIYEIKIQKKGLYDYTLSEWIYNDSFKKIYEEPFTYLKVENGKGLISERGKQAISIQKLEILDPNELVLRQISDQDRYYPLFTIKKAIEQISVYSYFDTTFDSVIRQLSPFFTETRLLSDGKNLTSLLSYLNANNTSAFDKITNEVKNINPNFREIVINIQTAGKSLLSLKENKLDKTISIEHISDGTLRFLLLLSIFYNPNRGKFICIDEPEIGLHPDMINTISTAIKYASKNGSQLIIATHSPLLLNKFELEDVLIFDKNDQNNTYVNRRNNEDFKDNEVSLVGQLWLNGELGGTRW